MKIIDPKEYEGADTHLTPKDYDMAFNSQSACNLSGIVKWQAGVLDRIWDEANARKQGTDWVNQHPINRLMAEQAAHLSGAGPCNGSATYSFAYEYCFERMKVKA